MAITLSGGTIAGNQGHGATVKPYGFARVQFDAAGTYDTGGYADFETFVRTVLGTKVTIVDCFQAKPGGAYHLFYDATNDKLMIYVGTTMVEVGNGVAVTITNAEILVIYE